jgi:hypothetical protein
MDFADQLMEFFNDLRDRAECEFWGCPRTGDLPHNNNCLTGSQAEE